MRSTREIRRMAAGATLAVVVVASSMGGCATSQPSARVAQQQDTRRLRVLERRFHRFVATPLPDVAAVEENIAVLERLRLEYLDALQRTTAERERVLALLRLAELHLDLSARVRRVPYPAGISEGSASASAFDQRLSARALPLEATGLSLLRQIAGEGSADRARGDDAAVAGDVAAEVGVVGDVVVGDVVVGDVVVGDVGGDVVGDGTDSLIAGQRLVTDTQLRRLVTRARLYLHLHTDEHLTSDDLTALQRELVAVSWRAPRSLLDTGRIGQRAARR